MIKIKDDVKKWKIPTVDGIIQTGYFEYWRAKEKEIGEIDNLIFTAWIKPSVVGRGRSAVTFTFIDKDDPIVYATGATGMMELNHALVDGRLGIENRYIYGVFTFKKQGDSIYLFPAEKP